MWKNRSKLLFGSSILLSGLLFLQMGLYVLHVLLRWDLPWNLFQICNDELQSHGFLVLGYALDGLVFYTMLVMLVKTARQLIVSRSLYKKLVTQLHRELTSEINRRYSRTGQAFLVIRSAKPIALTMGLFQPKIILSTGLLQLLDNSEAEAVIHHELFHHKHRDPLKTFLLALFAAVFWYLPILRWVQNRYQIVREVLADSHAIERSGSAAAIGGALLKLVKCGSSADLAVTFVSFADTSINFRIQQILDEETELSLRLPFTATIVSVYVLVLLFDFFLLSFL